MNATDDRPRVASASRSPLEVKARWPEPKRPQTSFYAAFESVIDKLESRLRRTKDRKKVHYGDKRPVSVAEATASLVDADSLGVTPDISLNGQEPDEYDGPGRVVRTKDHPAEPMTIDDALYEMELVGHDFFLFHDKESDKPSVVYRRHAFDYGIDPPDMTQSVVGLLARRR